MDLRFRHPSSFLIAGPSSCGKTVFVKRLLQYRHQMFDVTFHSIVWCYGEYQNFYEELRQQHNVQFHEGLPSMSSFDGKHPTLLIIDDLMQEAGDSVANLFTKGSHHRNISVIFITQNLFHQGKKSRDISLNAHYLVCFKNPRDKTQIHHLARQLFPEKPKFVQEAFTDATLIPHGYLLIDLKQSTPDNVRLRSLLFPDDSATVVYQPKRV